MQGKAQNNLENMISTICKSIEEMIDCECGQLL